MAYAQDHLRTRWHTHKEVITIKNKWKWYRNIVERKTNFNAHKCFQCTQMLASFIYFHSKGLVKVKQDWGPSATRFESYQFERGCKG